MCLFVRRFKVKVGLNKSEDEHRVQMVRQQIGADCDLVWFISPVSACFVHCLHLRFDGLSL